MRGKVEPSIIPTVVQAIKQTSKIPQITTPWETQLREQKHEVLQMTSPQEKQPREYNQEIKREHDTGFQKGEKHLHFDVNVYDNWMETITSRQHLQQ